MVRRLPGQSGPAAFFAPSLHSRVLSSAAVFRNDGIRLVSEKRILPGRQELPARILYTPADCLSQGRGNASGPYDGPWTCRRARALASCIRRSSRPVAPVRPPRTPSTRRSCCAPEVHGPFAAQHAMGETAKPPRGCFHERESPQPRRTPSGSLHVRVSGIKGEQGAVNREL